MQAVAMQAGTMQAGSLRPALCRRLQAGRLQAGRPLGPALLRRCADRSLKRSEVALYGTMVFQAWALMVIQLP